MTETSEITTPILEALKKAGIFAMRLNSGKVKVRGGWMTLCPEGTADIVVYPEPQSGFYDPVIWIETKQADGKHRAAQLKFKDRVMALGHQYLTMRDPKDVDKWLGDWK